MNLGFQGKTFKPGQAGYDEANDIYATSTYGKERDLAPGVIYQPASIADIQEVFHAVNQPGVEFTPIAIRSGGHQYSGASSTGPHGIQLDLKPTFRSADDLKLIRDDANNKVYIRSSVSWELSEFYKFLEKNDVFLPTGQCATVCLGGHVQTGGYGMLGRSFGLLGDYITELEIVDHNGAQVTVTKDSHPDLFYGFLGGSPGNLGVLTHFTVEVQEDKKHQGSKGMWLLFLYNQKTLKGLLDILVEKAEDSTFERNYDFNINVYSETLKIGDHLPDSNKHLKRDLPDDLIEDADDDFGINIRITQPVIIVYAQWVNFGKDVYNPDLFKRLRDPVDSFWHRPIWTRNSDPGDGMSKITSGWLFTSDREFEFPYVKHTGTTKSATLSTDGWSEWFSGQIDKAVNTKDLFVSSQLQPYGGSNSMFWKNAGNGTAYSWRDATVVGTWDIFYNGDDAQKPAEDWQAETEAGAEKFFDKDERRVLWGSYGEWDMKKVWPHYYDSQTYKKLQQIRKDADPRGIFNANPFCVEAAQ